ncbi:hypothetical protein YC2023_108182 [Brassica napus]
MLTLEPFSEDQGRSAVHPLLGPCFKTGRLGSPHADAVSMQMPRHAPWTEFTARLGLHSQTTELVDSASWCDRSRGATGSGHDGALTLSGTPFQGTWARSISEAASPDYNSNAKDVRISSWALPGSRCGLWVIKSFWTGTSYYMTRIEFTTACQDAPGVLSLDFGQPRAMCARPEGLGRNLRSKTRWFTGFCNSHQVSHFATFFIDARAEISITETHFRLYIAALLPTKHRLRVGESRLFSCIFLDTFLAGAQRQTTHVAAIQTLHRIIQSVGATGGVYKGQGRSQRELITRAY